MSRDLHVRRQHATHLRVEPLGLRFVGEAARSVRARHASTQGRGIIEIPIHNRHAEVVGVVVADMLVVALKTPLFISLHTSGVTRVKRCRG